MKFGELWEFEKDPNRNGSTLNFATYDLDVILNKKAKWETKKQKLKPY